MDVPTFENLWRQAPADLEGMTDRQIAEAKRIALYVYRQVKKHVKNRKHD